MNNKDTIYVCVVGNKHALQKEIIEALKKIHSQVVEIHNDIFRFESGEHKPVIKESVRNKDVIVISTLEENIDTEVLKLLFTIDALRRASANRIDVLMPYLYYDRQDKTSGKRESISCAILARFYELCGASSMTTVHLHNEAIEGFFHGPCDSIGTRKLFWNHLKNYCIAKDEYFDPSEWMIIFPDEGASKIVRDYVKRAGAGGYAGFSKQRIVANDVEWMDFFGKVEGMRCFVFDDKIDTGGTLVKAGKLLIEQGAKETIAACTYGLLNRTAPTDLQNSAYSKIFITDLMNIPESKLFNKLEIVGTAEYLAEVLIKKHHGESLREEYW